MTKYIAVASGKGGTGKSTTAINLASALTQLGRSTILLDANVSTPNVSLYLGYHDLYPTLQDVLAGKHSMKEAIYIHHSGLKLIPSNIYANNKTDFGEHLNKAVLQLFGHAEFVIIDVAAGLGDEAISAIKSSDELLIVTNPNLASVTDAMKTIKVAEEHDVNVLGVTVNRVIGDKYDMPLQSISAMLKKPILSVIPEDHKIKESHQMKHPLVCSHPHSPAAKEFKKLAEMFL